MKMEAAALPVKCANVTCPNETTQGQFHLTTLGEGNIVGGHRPLTVLLCAPCVQGLAQALGG